MPLSHIQPDAYATLLQQKSAAVSALMAPFDPPSAVVVASPPTGFRMRAEFRVWHQGEDLDYVMFRRGEPKTPIPVEHFPIACERIQSLMPTVREWVKGNVSLRRRLFQIEFLSSSAGDTLLTLVYHRPLDEDWDSAASALSTGLGVSVVGRSRGQKRVIGRDFITEQLFIHGRRYDYRQYEQSFTQPNATVNVAMIEWARDQAAGVGDDLLELYCGNGNFTLPLAERFEEVIATEVSKSSIRAAQENIESNAIINVQVVRLSAEETTSAMRGEREFRRLRSLRRPLGEYRLHTLLVDPPRAGLDDATLHLATGFDRVLYISCNPVTLADNLRVLTRTHAVASFAQFDQFPYTDHMECGVLLMRK